VLKDGYWEIWCTTGERRLLIHLYHDGKVVATTSNGDLWVFDWLEVIQEKTAGLSNQWPKGIPQTLRFRPYSSRLRR
jgi:hypothetical protein